MAEGLFIDILGRLSPARFDVRSRGITAVSGEPPDDVAISLLREKEIDISAHRARQISEDDIHWANLILVMEEFHQKKICQWFPQAKGKVYRLGHFEKSEITDPYRQPQEVFQEVLEQVESSVAAWVWELTHNTTANQSNIER
ncbi:MAG: low molecular weight phosphotyrosine protein phosphatase [Phycisphaerae bacterium]|nr:low molecular weight phosphotyrosine protein phosphatase [Phycisphaerae bacterium]NIP55022.1 low molecular weight phosphotyrosine protein phosphatase [Phycisphaerae bacterium]NIX31116.1 low molecular weight phosphotyrosine protein phosphatase [Phycisphaerae bacterium]